MEQIYKLYSSLGQLESGKKWAEIDLSALRQNYRALRTALAPSSPCPIAVLKADAYGHGAPPCVEALLEEDCRFFAVSCIDEALAVRRVCREKQASADILILGYTAPSLAKELSGHNLIQSVLSFDYAKRLNAEAGKNGTPVRVHLAVDTGMNRIGFPCHSASESADTADKIAETSALPFLKTEGLFSHFSSADAPSGSDGELRTQRQSERFSALINTLKQKNIRLPFLHICNSVAALNRPCDRFDGVRFGILLYGAYAPCPPSVSLRPVMKLKASIIHLHALQKGESVSYGGTYTASEPRLIATLPIGYADGLLRNYSGAEVTLKTDSGTHISHIVGKICMDQCMIDVTGTGAKEGDTVTFFGNRSEELCALAEAANTLPYECICLISSRVPRIYCGDESQSRSSKKEDSNASQQK